jgi:hypothetical protein
MKKAIWVVNINNYRPDVTKYTLPNIKAYADRIGAEYKEITNRKYPDWPITYEKLQIHELGAEYDWNILCDADVLISKDMPDITTLIPINYIGAHGSYNIGITVKEPDLFFARDGRQIGVATYFMATSSIMHDIWTPLEMSSEEAVSKMKREFVIDEYCISRNLARFGMRLTGVTNKAEHIYHLSLTTEKPEEDIKRIEEWIQRDKNGDFA